MREENIKGIKIGGMSIQMLRFAADIAVIADNEEDLTKMLKKNDMLKEYHIKINQRKTF